MLECLITLLVLGLIFFFVSKYVPMPEPFRIVFYILVAVMALIVLIRCLHLMGVGLAL